VHAQAAASSKAAAETLFDEARELLAAEKFAEACAKFEQSQAIDPGIGTLFYLAHCYEQQGRVASAWATFREAASQAKAAGQLDRANRGEMRAAALKPRLARLTIQVASETASLEGLSVTRNERAVPGSLFNVAFPVDPGEHTIQVKAPGYRPFSASVTFSKDAETQLVSVPALEEEESAPVAAPQEPTPEPATNQNQTMELDQDTASSGSGQRTVGVVLGVAGLASLGVGVVFGLQAKSDDDKSKDFCGAEGCWDRRGEELSDDAQTAALIANIGYGIGALGVIGGLVR
jgi:serine/threonine-protein kinase